MGRIDAHSFYNAAGWAHRAAWAGGCTPDHLSLHSYRMRHDCRGELWSARNPKRRNWNNKNRMSKNIQIKFVDEPNSSLFRRSLSILTWTVIKTEFLIAPYYLGRFKPVIYHRGLLLTFVDLTVKIKIHAKDFNLLGAFAMRARLIPCA